MRILKKDDGGTCCVAGPSNQWRDECIKRSTCCWVPFAARLEEGTAIHVGFAAHSKARGLLGPRGVIGVWKKKIPKLSTRWEGLEWRGYPHLSPQACVLRWSSFLEKIECDLAHFSACKGSNSPLENPQVPTSGFARALVPSNPLHSTRLPPWSSFQLITTREATPA